MSPRPSGRRGSLDRRLDEVERALEVASWPARHARSGPDELDAKLLGLLAEADRAEAVRPRGTPEEEAERDRLAAGALRRLVAEARGA